jgi:arylsulfatase A-like enzyme
MKLSLVLAVSLFVLPATLYAADDAKPNIIFFLVDDMGWQDTSVPFWTQPTPLNKKFHTPNMEKLAADGMKFTQAYACCVCSPSRVSLMTGLNAMRHRVTNWTLNKDKSPDVSNLDLKPPAWNWCGISPTPGLPRTAYVKPLPMFLREAGYRTIHVGKAHFGAVGTIGEDPLKLGFDVNIAGHAAGGPGSYLSEDEYGNNKPGPWGVPGLAQYHHKGVFLTEALTLEANKAVDQAVADHKPFYLYMAHYAVHVPYAADPRYYRKYIDAGLDKIEAEYAGLIEGMDKSLGDILANVHRHGLSKNTIVLFMSDNGGLSVQARGGKPNTHNLPLSSGKGSAREGGIREPMIVRWPGVVQPGTTCNTPVIIEDYFPTILELAGMTPPPHWNSPGRGDEKQPLNVQGIDGVSFVSLLHGDTGRFPANRPMFWHYPNCWGPHGPGIGSTSTIRQGDFKLIYYHDPAAKPRYELFNIASDIGETHNLADAQPEVRDRLAAELGDHMRAVDAQMPVDKRTGKAIDYPSAARRGTAKD